jgi:hypothetical protein
MGAGRRMAEDRGRRTGENEPAAKAGGDTEACSHEEGNTPGEPQPVAFKSRSAGGRRSGLGGNDQSFKPLPFSVLGPLRRCWSRSSIRTCTCANAFPNSRANSAMICICNRRS